MAKNRIPVAFKKTEDRQEGVVSSIGALNINPVRNKQVLIKPNFNTADQVPGSTHNDTLAALVREVWNRGRSPSAWGPHRPGTWISLPWTNKAADIATGWPGS